MTLQDFLDLILPDFFKHDTARFCFFYKTHILVLVRSLQTEEACAMFPDDCQQPHFNEGTQTR